MAGPASVAAGAPSAPRLPLSSIVSALVDDWSRSYTVEALKGDVESMCMLAQGHFSRNGWGCIPRDTERGHDWLARAKARMLEQACADAKRMGRKACPQSHNEKLNELERDVLDENVFEVCHLSADAPLDDTMSSGSLASLETGSFSCDREGGDTNAEFVHDVQVPTDGTTSAAYMESDGTSLWPSSSLAGFHHCAPSPLSRSAGVRNSVSHPDLSGEYKKARGRSSPLPAEPLYEADDGEAEEGDEPQPQPRQRSLSEDASADASTWSQHLFACSNRGSMPSSAASSAAMSQVASEADSGGSSSGSSSSSHSPAPLQLHASALQRAHDDEQEMQMLERSAFRKQPPLKRSLSAAM